MNVWKNSLKTPRNKKNMYNFQYQIQSVSVIVDTNRIVASTKQIHVAEIYWSHNYVCYNKGINFLQAIYWGH